ncbi:hypothetical protein GCM10009827_070180 [Dactylosporangium maewongense]|uniref:Uncharacterized protein n=1 Tax=Dactylosporangium maewongense TaxID=634393 RepID=A0ABN2BJV2_9ACTN
MPVLDEVRDGVADAGAVVGDDGGQVGSAGAVPEEHHGLPGGVEPVEVVAGDGVGEDHESGDVVPGDRRGERRRAPVDGDVRGGVEGLHGDGSAAGRGGGRADPGEDRAVVGAADERRQHTDHRTVARAHTSHLRPPYRQPWRRHSSNRAGTPDLGPVAVPVAPRTHPLRDQQRERSLRRSAAA